MQRNQHANFTMSNPFFVSKNWRMGSTLKWPLFNPFPGKQASPKPPPPWRPRFGKFLGGGGWGVWISLIKYFKNVLHEGILRQGWETRKQREKRCLKHFERKNIQKRSRTMRQRFLTARKRIRNTTAFLETRKRSMKIFIFMTIRVQKTPDSMFWKFAVSDSTTSKIPATIDTKSRIPTFLGGVFRLGEGGGDCANYCGYIFLCMFFSGPQTMFFFFHSFCSLSGECVAFSFFS